jgi:hypothetical protein
MHAATEATWKFGTNVLAFLRQCGMQMTTGQSRRHEKE